MKSLVVLYALIYSAIVGALANSFVLIKHFPSAPFILIALFVLLSVSAIFLTFKAKAIKIKFCLLGTVLLDSFCGSVVLSLVWQILVAIKYIPHDGMTFVWSLVVCIAVNAVVFWAGIICVYLTSTQLGIKLRVIGIICGMMPIANLVALFFIIKTTTAECLFETEKERINTQRKDLKICATKYPILLVHGVFFRDTKYFNYWGRIPKELETNGASIFYGNHSSAASVADSAAELKERIDEILTQTGADKVNIIAHSKGGLDCRYAIAKLGVSDRVASLTTVNTPHRGCLFADHLLTKIPTDIKDKVARAYNSALKKFGEAEADFLAAVGDLTESSCTRLNDELPAPEGIYCQSIGSVLTKATGGKFPLNFSHPLVKHYSGENDGLVSVDSFEWGEKFTLLKPDKKRGISHGDMIDLNRENIVGFDVREFYVNLVKELKSRGL